ncbi:hypothetical protein LC55x_4894 [Lysobacter capsici]|nr:hypothetical protein LC55x_4894 [Lysobacter capsici]
MLLEKIACRDGDEAPAHAVSGRRCMSGRAVERRSNCSEAASD